MASRRIAILAVVIAMGCRFNGNKGPGQPAPAEIPMPEASNRDRIVPIIRSIGCGTKPTEMCLRRQDIHPAVMSAQFEGRPIPPDQMPISDAFVGDLTIRYAVDGQMLMTNLTASNLLGLGLKREELLGFGIKNLHRLYPEARIERGEGFGMIVQSGDLESSWMLDFEFWADEAKRFKGELVASVPAREIMVWGDTSNSDLIESLRETGLKIHSGEIASNRAISTLLYVWRNGAWEVYDRDGDP